MGGVGRFGVAQNNQARKLIRILRFSIIHPTLKTSYSIISKSTCISTKVVGLIIFNHYSHVSNKKMATFINFGGKNPMTTSI